MELNTEQIKKALEWWTKNFDGKATDFKTLCEATLLIKELAEEVASWKEIAEGYQKQFEDCYIELEAMRGAANSYKMHNEKLTEENKRLHASCTELTQNLHNYMEASGAKKLIADTRADTVWKMAEAIKESASNGWNKSIDQIAKELLEE